MGAGHFWYFVGLALVSSALTLITLELTAGRGGIADGLGLLGLWTERPPSGHPGPWGYRLV